MSATKLASNRSPNWAFMQRFEVPDYDTDGIYLTRWRVVQTPWFGVYVHRFDGPDPRPTLHDHPWPFVSFVLRGGYTEMLPLGSNYADARDVKRVNRKKATDTHWISRLHRVPTWTLMFVGRRQREWGYLDEDSHWTVFYAHPYNDQFNAALARQKSASVVGRVGTTEEPTP